MNKLSGFYLRFFDEIEGGGVWSRRFWGFEGRKNRDQESENRGKGRAMELARARVRVAFCWTILACEPPLQGLCAKRGELPASMVRAEGVGFKQVSQGRLGEGVAFFWMGYGRSGCRPA